MPPTTNHENDTQNANSHMPWYCKNNNKIILEIKSKSLGSLKEISMRNKTLSCRKKLLSLYNNWIPVLQNKTFKRLHLDTHKTILCHLVFSIIIFYQHVLQRFFIYGLNLFRWTFFNSPFVLYQKQNRKN